MRHSVTVLLGIGDGRLTSLNAIGFARHRPTWSTIDRCGVESCLHSSSSSSDSSGSNSAQRAEPSPTKSIGNWAVTKRPSTTFAKAALSLSLRGGPSQSPRRAPSPDRVSCCRCAYMVRSSSACAAAVASTGSSRCRISQ